MKVRIEYTIEIPENDPDLQTLKKKYSTFKIRDFIWREFVMAGIDGAFTAIFKWAKISKKSRK